MAREVTRRQLQVLLLVARGYRAREIAEMLTITQSTVQAHVEKLFIRFHTASRTALVVHALKAGALHLEDV